MNDSQATQRVRGFVCGRWARDNRRWVITVNQDPHFLFRKKIVAREIREGVNIERNDSVDFRLVKDGTDYFAHDVASIRAQ